jgi:lysyl-tRNA synthetase class 2
MGHTRGASLTTLQRRAAILARIREFFAAREVLEVETPALSTAAVSDPNIDSIVARVEGRSPATHYLHTSPEYAMKRLLADGSGDVYQLCRVFRDGELGRWHQPEFTMLEWYRVNWDENALMSEVAELVNHVLRTPRPVRRVSYAEAFRAALDVDPLEAAASLRDVLPTLGIHVPDGLDEPALLDLALTAVVVPKFDAGTLTFVHDYPAAQAALAALRTDDPRVAARFELFSDGLELGNGFRELTDAREQRRRFEHELAERAARHRAQPPLDEDFLEALPRLPACAGVAVGVDRLVALDGRLNGLAQTVSFAHD